MNGFGIQVCESVEGFLGQIETLTAKKKNAFLRSSKEDILESLPTVR